MYQHISNQCPDIERGWQTKLRPDRNEIINDKKDQGENSNQAGCSWNPFYWIESIHCLIVEFAGVWLICVCQGNYGYRMYQLTASEMTGIIIYIQNFIQLSWLGSSSRFSCWFREHDDFLWPPLAVVLTNGTYFWPGRSLTCWLGYELNCCVDEYCWIAWGWLEGCEV